jgi:hypothetical protein
VGRHHARAVAANFSDGRGTSERLSVQHFRRQLAFTVAVETSTSMRREPIEAALRGLNHIVGLACVAVGDVCVLRIVGVDVSVRVSVRACECA